jgi:hypothetical protein
MNVNEKPSSSWIWGFTSSSENWNGRMAMLGFLITLIIELISGKGVLHFIGVI